MNAFLCFCKRVIVVAIAAVCFFGAFTPTVLADEYQVKMGSDMGMLAFEPAKIAVKAGDTITWVNNKVFPHNVVFNGAINPGGAALSTSFSQKQLMMSPGQEFKVTIPADAPAGDYAYYCEPHRGAGMQGTITVQ